MRNYTELRYEQSGHGHYRLQTTLRGKKIGCVTTNVEAIDMLRDNGFGEYKRGAAKATKELISECRAKYRNGQGWAI